MAAGGEALPASGGVMGLRAMTWAYEQKLPCVHKFLLVTLGEFADRENKCWPSQATLAEVCGLTRQHVNKCLADLVRDGYVATEQRVRPNGATASCCYHVLVSSSPTPPVYQDDTPPVIQDDGHYVEPSIYEPSKEPLPPISPKGDLKGEFADWWQAYPHKVGKGAAEQKFAIARRIASTSELAEGVQRYIDKKNPDHAWCNPATWLHQKRWLDQPADAPSNYHDKPIAKMSPVEKLYLGGLRATENYIRSEGIVADDRAPPLPLLDSGRSTGSA